MSASGVLHSCDVVQVLSVSSNLAGYGSGGLERRLRIGSSDLCQYCQLRQHSVWICTPSSNSTASEDADGDVGLQGGELSTDIATDSSSEKSSLIVKGEPAPKI